jgi:hypothetical protein
MRKAYGIRCGPFWLVIALSLLGALLLSACGNATGAHTQSGAASSSSQPAATPTTIKGYGTSHGCPSDAVVSTTPTAGAVVVKASQNDQTITVHKGDIVIFELPFGHRWSAPAGSQGVLELQPPAGYASLDTQSCIWRYVAQSSGQSKVIFLARALCNPGQLCPQYIIQFSFTIKVE